MPSNLLVWNQAFSVGIQKIDAQHQQLFKLINSAIFELQTKRSTRACKTLLRETLAYTSYHFRTEEELLRIHHHFEAHVRMHRAFEAKLHSLLEKAAENSAAVAEEAAELLYNWLSQHVLRIDCIAFEDLGYQSKSSTLDTEARIQLLSRRLKVLVVDDSDLQRKIITKNLQDAGFEVLEASNGEDAFSKIQQTDGLYLLLTDLSMPVMDGQMLIRKIRTEHLAPMYIIALTASTSHTTLLETFNAGANDYLTKPVFYPELHVRLRNGLTLLQLESQDELLLALARLADRRSPETGKHLDRVRSFAHLLAKQVLKMFPDSGMTELLVTDIAKYSPLHDIGKVAIPDAILQKPGKLTVEEYERMKAHAQIGGDLIGEILRKTGVKSLQTAYEIVAYHHEKWDGTGYPVGLSGAEIPIAARIVAIADVYDALTSVRAYKKAFSREYARQLICKAADLHFDPFLVQAFEEIEPLFHQIREELQDDSNGQSSDE